MIFADGDRDRGVRGNTATQVFEVIPKELVVTRRTAPPGIVPARVVFEVEDGESSAALEDVEVASLTVLPRTSSPSRSPPSAADGARRSARFAFGRIPGRVARGGPRASPVSEIRARSRSCQSIVRQK